MSRSDSYASSAHTLESDDEVPLELAEYYDKAGDVSVISDSLNDLELDRIEKRTQRDLLRDQDTRPITSEEQFEAAYNDERSVLRNRLHDTRSNVDILRSQCIRMGLDVESRKWRKARISRGSGSSPTHAVHTVDVSSRTPSMTSSSSVADSTSLPPNIFGTHGNRPTPWSWSYLGRKDQRTERFEYVSNHSYISTATCNRSDLGRPGFLRAEKDGSSVVPGAAFHKSDGITDPDLRHLYGVTAHKKLSPYQPYCPSRHPGWRSQAQPQGFFTVGRVFFMPLGEATADDDTSITLDAAAAYCDHPRCRRLVVVKESDTYCSAIPITTLNGEGVAKPGVKKSNFTIIYTGGSPPPALDVELRQRNGEPMRPNPIRVDPGRKGVKLDTLSRLNFAKVYTVDHSAKVRSFGMVHRDSKRDLLYQFKDVWLASSRTAVPNEGSLSSTFLAVLTASGATKAGTG